MMTAFRKALLRFVVGMTIIESSSTRQLRSDADVSGSDVASVGRKQQALFKEWANALDPKVDYSGTHGWREMFRSDDAEEYFIGYTKKFSQIAKRLGASVNFISVGACDGTDDYTINELFLTQSHWRGVFVEPISNNFAELTTFLEVNGVANRSTAIRGAATSACPSPYLVMKRPTEEERNKSAPHWLRRQIGHVIPQGQKSEKGWILEKVRCLTTEDILSEWGHASSGAHASLGGKTTSSKSRKRRPHVLKIDTEGHDLDVLNGFLKDSTLVSDLPLLILFEAKMLGLTLPQAIQKLQSAGYAVGIGYAYDRPQDGFALLKADMIYVPGEKGLNSHLKGVTLDQLKTMPQYANMAT